MARNVKSNQRGYGPPGWPNLWPVGWDKEIASVQARAHYAQPGAPAQGHLLGHVIPESNNRDSDITPAVHGDDADHASHSGRSAQGGPGVMRARKPNR
jgi:hypothetical protein